MMICMLIIRKMMILNVVELIAIDDQVFVVVTDDLKMTSFLLLLQMI